MIVYRFDQDGYYLEPVEINISEQVPADCTRNPLPEINYKPKFVDGAWIETLSQEEINQILNAPKPKSPIEILQETVDQLVLYNLMGGL